MRPEDFNSNAPGDLVSISVHGTQMWAFAPRSLPPAWELNAEIVNRLVAAERAMGELNGLAQQLPNPYLLINPYIRREAVASSRIEGTRTDLRELLLFEADARTSESVDDAKEVENYVTALQYALSKPEDRAISLSLIRETHQLLLTGVRGSDKRPGEFRPAQVFIGSRGAREARFIPPPPDMVEPLMRDLESFIASDSDLPQLVRIAMIHYQFEAIHPFLDGNGRTGRVLISMLLGEWSILRQPILYLSEFFERHRRAYMNGLLGVSQRGDWTEWVAFFLDAIVEQAYDGARQGRSILALRETYRKRYQAARSVRLLPLIDELFMRPVFTAAQISESLGWPRYSVQRLLEPLIADRVLVETTGKQRNRIYLAPEIMQLLEE
jgi:cell filamentation protein, protein adenylyltransferase